MRVIPYSPAATRENELLGTITLIGERHIAQYDVLYTEEPGQAAAIFEVPYTHTQSYINPEVTMPMSGDGTLCVGGVRQQAQVQPDRDEGARDEGHGQQHLRRRGLLLHRLLVAEQDQDSLRHRGNPREADGQEGDQGDQLADYRAVARVHAQLCEEVQKDYRNVMVLPKLTFPDEKVLRIEISENQISGRVIVLTIEYEDILHADGFDADILKDAAYYPYYYISYSDKQ